MNSLDKKVAYYIEHLEGDDKDDAFHNLIECPPKVIPTIIQIYPGVSSPGIKTAIIEVLGHFRSSQTIAFLKNTLDDNNPDIWKQSLDTLVCIGKESLEILNESLDNEKSDEKKSWIAEAIDQIQSKKK